jgi:electron transfer flavoprotein beta subunit
MKILVPVKRAVDYGVRIQVKPDGSGVNTDGVKFSMNPFDEIAIEEAVRLKEAGTATEIVAVSVGPKAAQETLRTALAFGADRAIHIETDGGVQPPTVARILAKVFENESADLMIMGKQAIDDDSNQTGQMTSALLNIPQATFAGELKIDGSTAEVVREIDSGLETLSVDLPAIVTADLRLNEPRYLKLPDIMKAKRKPLEATDMAALGVEAGPALTISKTSPPAKRDAGIMVKSVDELVSVLKERDLI